MADKKILKDYIDSIFEFYARNGIEFGNRPRIELDNEKVSRFDPFIPTGHYNYVTDTITLRIDQRQVKDILRTLCHELIHVWQCRRNPDEYQNFDKTGDLKDNPILQKYEEEAFLKGNIMFRQWTEEMKKDQE